MISIENIPRHLGELEIRSLLERCGAVAQLVFEKSLDRCAALARMKEREAALDAVMHLNGSWLHGKRLVVRSVRRP